MFTVRVENKNHPITAGVEDFQIFDEQHTVKYYLDREHLLLRSIAPDNLESEAGWWRDVGKGRFAYLAPGHTPEALGASDDAAAHPECHELGAAAVVQLFPAIDFLPPGLLSAHES